MEQLFRMFIEPMQEVYLLKALLGGSVVAIVCGVIGCLIILRRMAFLGDALSHAMIAGVAGGYLFMKMLFGIEASAPAMLLGSLLSAIITVALIGFVSRVSRVKEDSAIGIMYTGVFAAGVVLVSVFREYIHIDLMHFIMGDVLGISDADLWASAISSALVLSLVILFFRHFQISSFDPVMAATIGLPILLIDYMLTTCVSLVVVSAVSMVGVIMVVGLLITPAATAYLLTDRLSRMMMLAAAFGFTSVLGGLYLCLWLDSSGGGAIMLWSTLQFLLVLFLAPRYGMLSRWLRLRKMIPQQTIEDILQTVFRNQPAPTPLKFIDNFITGHGHGNVIPAIKSLLRDGFLTGDMSSGLLLTDKGNEQAARILRAHRLWEAYLHHVGVPDEELHARAHKLEHVDRDVTIGYLDEILSHPRVDPHGKEIPGN